MDVIFDYQIFRLQKYGGISRYFIELAKHLQHINGCNPFIIATNSINEYLHELHNEKIYHEESYLLKKATYNRFWDYRDEYAELLLNLKINKQSILHETYYTHRLPSKLKRVITIHDMIYELKGQNLSEKELVLNTKKEAIEQADHIIAVSENTKQDLLQFYPEAKNKVTVVHHGITKTQHKQIMPFNNDKPYILFVGNREGYKNFESLLEVYIANSEINKNFDLICFGGDSFYNNEIESINKYNLQFQVKHLKGNDDLLNSLYKGASVLAYLSNYEGFGLPVLEAMWLNCPVICSNGSSLPEVAGNCAQLINVEDKQEILNALNKILFSKDNFKDMIDAGKNRAESFSWQKCAEETYNVYKGLQN